MAAIALVRLLPAVHPLVSVQVVALNKTHVARITSKWLLPCMSKNVSLEVVTTPESSVAVVTDEVLLDFQRTVIAHVDLWN